MVVRKIHIQNFLSVKELTYSFEEGLHLFTGDNGAGKTTILQALQVGLFNKCDRPQPWARLSGPGGFIITTEFQDIHGKEITTVNNRTNNRFEVYENGELLTHQISKALPLVSSKLNLSYHEFSMLSYLTPTTVSSILTGTDSSLISKFFSLHVLSDYDKSLREERKLLTRDKKAMEAQLSDAISNSKVYDVSKLKSSLASWKESLRLLYNSNDVNTITELEKDLASNNLAMTIAQTELKNYKFQLQELNNETSICPTCGSDLDTDINAKLTTITNTQKEIKRYKQVLLEYEKENESLGSRISFFKIPFEKESKKLEKNISKAEAELLAASILEKRDTIDIDKLSKDLTIIERKILSLNITIEAIKSGDVHKSYLQTFTSVLNTNLGNIRETLGISMRVIAKIDSNGLSFSVLDDGVYKFSDVLSAGEKVIVGLMVLSAMFETLGDTLDIKVSTIMLDEAISAVSTENMEVVESLLKELGESKCVIITQHHDELPEDLFSTINVVQKVDGLTEII